MTQPRKRLFLTKPSARCGHRRLLPKALIQMAQVLISEWQQVLTDTSWFVLYLNEYLALKTNIENRFTGRFLDGQLKSQAFLEEATVVNAMAYVGLTHAKFNLATTLQNLITIR